MIVEEIAEGGDVLVEKRLSGREIGEPEAAASLRAEGRLLGILGGRVTPRLVSAGEDGRGPFIRMAKIPFPTVADRTAAGRERPEPDPSWVERATRAAFEALAELHEARDDEGPLAIVHADLSPANVAIDDAGSSAVLLDLGLAVFRGSPPRDGAFRGTAHYCAPELARGEPPTAQSDLFSLAATLAFAITGGPLRVGASLAALILHAAEHPVLPVLDARRPNLAARGPGHAAIVACLAHEPGDRPASARTVLSRLHPPR